MQELLLNEKIIKKIKLEAIGMVRDLCKENLVQMILYGSCARGDYTEDSDVDIALIVKCNRTESQKYTSDLAAIATELAMKYFAIVNFVCIPYEEFMEKKSWYTYFRNIEREGEVLYGQRIL